MVYKYACYQEISIQVRFITGRTRALCADAWDCKVEVPSDETKDRVGRGDSILVMVAQGYVVVDYYS